MKRIIPIIILAGILFASCEYEEYHDPYADFSVDYDLIIPGEVITFSNYSEDAAYFEWDFGDGSYSNAVNPSHYYSHEGVYEVSLAARYGSRVDYTYMTIEVYETTLEVVVREYFSNELIPRANVVIYPSEYEYQYFGIEVFRGLSDYNGSVVVTGMNTQSYYIDVYNDLYNNYTLASEDLNFITTTPLVHAMHNVFTAYVDYDPAGFKSTDEKIKIREVKITTEKRTFANKKQMK